jgi:transcriptional regulator with XRE-family HTH domain
MSSSITIRDYVVNTVRDGARRASHDVIPSMDFRRQLRLLRTRAGFTQEQLAHACGWAGQSRIANYEASPQAKHAREPTLSEVSLLAKALNVTEMELLGLGTPSLSDDEQQLIDWYRDMDEENRGLVVGTARGLARRMADDPADLRKAG